MSRDGSKEVLFTEADRERILRALGSKMVDSPSQEEGGASQAAGTESVKEMLINILQKLDKVGEDQKRLQTQVDLLNVAVSSVRK